MEYPVAYLHQRTRDFDLLGQAGNTFAIVAVGREWLIQLGMKEHLETFSEEMFSGDYDNVLNTMDKWFDLGLYDYYYELIEDEDYE